MVSLVSYPMFVKGLENTIGLNNLGVSVMPHKSPYILTTSWLTIGLHILARVLMGGGINFIYLVVYGMKVPLCEVQQLLSVRKPCHPPQAKLDIGINVDCPFIPVFRITPGYEGRIYLMFLLEYGFICMTLHLEDAHDVELELKCYPRVLHAVKAAGVTMNIPCTNKGMKSKLELISMKF